MTAHPDLLMPDPATMRSVLGHFCTGIAVVTGHDGSRPLGFTCQSVTSVSLEPPYVSFCPASTSATWPLIRSTGTLAINVLAHDQRDLCARFATSGADKFLGVSWSPGHNGSPVLDGTVATVEAELEYEHGAGDHTIVVAHVTGLRSSPDLRPLLYFRGEYGGLDASTR